jgi:hypothetical protein
MFDWAAKTDDFSGRIEWEYDALDCHTEYLKFEFQNACDELPIDVRVIESSLEFMDWNDDLIEVIDQIDHA